MMLRVAETRKSRFTFFFFERRGSITFSENHTFEGKKPSNIFSFLLPAGIRWKTAQLPQNRYASFHHRVHRIALVLAKLKTGHWYLLWSMHPILLQKSCKQSLFFYTVILSWAQHLETRFCMCLTFNARIMQLKSSSHEIPHTLLGKVVITAGNIPWSYVYKGHLYGEQT